MTDQQKDDMSMSRRRFLKKTVYKTPTLIALGLLIKPNTGLADGTASGLSGPSGPPGSWSAYRNQRR